MMVDSESTAGLRFKCPECGAPLQQREGKMGPFWGCSEFPKCRATLNDIQGKPSKDVDNLYRCPLCTRRLVRAAPEKGDYWFCSGYSKGCKATFLTIMDGPKLPSNVRSAAHARQTYRENGEFWGCSGYPDCKATFNDLNGGPDFDFLLLNIRKKPRQSLPGLRSAQPVCGLSPRGKIFHGKSSLTFCSPLY